MNSSSLILLPFNGLFFLLFAAFAVFFLILSLIMRRCSDKTRRATRAGLMLFTLALFVWYKIMLARDAEYSAITAAAGKGAFSWWGELPFQLCNINIFMIPLGLLLDNTIIMAASFFSSIIGATLALSMPCKGMEEGSYLMPRFYGFYGFHILLVFTASLLMGLDLYYPEYSHVIPLICTVYAEAVFAFLISYAIRRAGLNDQANYFYTYGGEGNPALEFIWSKIPIPCIYLIPAFVILIPVVYLLVFLLRFL